MIIEIYGRQDCTLCESASKKVALLLKKWKLNDAVRVVFWDTTTVDGAAEGDFFDVFEIPSVLLKRSRDEVIARWNGKAPPGDELQRHLSA